MSSWTVHDDHTRRILDAVETKGRVSQRSLASELGIALGLTNLLIRRLVRKGWVRVIQIEANRVAYLITPAGIAEKARMSRRYFESNVRYYRQTRDRIRDRFSTLSSTWPTNGAYPVEKRIVFLGAGEVAEIGYVCLAETDLRLVGVIDPARTTPFFGLPVAPPQRLGPSSLDGQSFDRLVVMSFGDADSATATLASLGFPVERAFWL